MTVAEFGRGPLLQAERPDAPQERFLGGDLPRRLADLLIGVAPTGLLRIVDESVVEGWTVTVSGFAARIERHDEDGTTVSHLTSARLLPLALVHEHGLGDRGPGPTQAVSASTRWLLGEGGRPPPRVEPRRFLVGDASGAIATAIVRALPSGYLIGIVTGESPEVTLVPASGLDVWRLLVSLAAGPSPADEGAEQPLSSPPG